MPGARPPSSRRGGFGTRAAGHARGGGVVDRDPADEVGHQLQHLRLQGLARAFVAHARVHDLAQRAHDRARHRDRERPLARRLLEAIGEEALHVRGALRPALHADRAGGAHLHAHQLGQVGTVADGHEQLTDERLQLRGPALGGLGRLDQPPREVLDDLVVGGQQALLLVVEVLVEAAPRDARAGDEVGDRRGQEALLVDGLDHRLEQALALVRRDRLPRQRLRPAWQPRAGPASTHELALGGRPSGLGSV